MTVAIKLIALFAGLILFIMIGIYVDCRVSGRPVDECGKAFRLVSEVVEAGIAKFGR